jgi:type 1 glutamine amidotransferase
MKTPACHTLSIALFVALFVALIGTATFSAAAESRDPRKKLVMLIAEGEYQTAKTLPEFAAKYLQKDFRVVTVSGTTAVVGENIFDHIEEVSDADVLLVSTRRCTPPKSQLDVIRRYVASGKPVVGIRTACHAFALLKNQQLAPGNDVWPEFDAQVIGGNYVGHHGNAVATVTAANSGHALLRGVTVPFSTEGGLYKVSPLRPGAQPLLTGAITGMPAEPVAWTFSRADGGRTFFTSLGHPADFKNAAFTELLRNGINWAAGSAR